MPAVLNPVEYPVDDYTAPMVEHRLTGAAAGAGFVQGAAERLTAGA